MGKLRDYLNSGSVHRGEVIGQSGGYNFRGAQSFTASAGYSIASVKLLLYKDGTPGTITVGIYAIDGSGFPTDSALAQGTTNGNTLTIDSDGEWREITFAAAYTLTNGTQYAIYVEAAGYKVRWNIHNEAGGAGYANGKFAYRINGAGWYFPNSGNDDAFFETYDNFSPPIPGGVNKNPMRIIKRLVAAAANKFYYEDI